MDFLLILKRTVNEKELILFSRQNIFYSYLSFYRWTFLAIGHWPNQNKMYSFFLKICQLIISAIFMKGQVKYFYCYLKMCNFHLFNTKIDFQIMYLYININFYDEVCTNLVWIALHIFIFSEMIFYQLNRKMVIFNLCNNGFIFLSNFL